MSVHRLIELEWKASEGVVFTDLVVSLVELAGCSPQMKDY